MARYLSAEPDPFPAPTHLTVRAAARTDRGRERPNNEDRAAFLFLEQRLAFEAPASAVCRSSQPVVAVVCDGMGGEAGGEIASRLAVETIVARLRDERFAASSDPATPLVRSLEQAAARIQREARADPRHARMGTTATLAALAPGWLVCAQVGDSRAYVFRRGALVQVTRDQTLAELVRSRHRELAPGAELAVGAHVILQALGSSPRLEIAVTETAIEPGDAILLCSDGLSGAIDDGAIASALGEHDDPDHACAALVERALAAGGPDNITCVVLRVAESADSDRGR